MVAAAEEDKEAAAAVASMGYNINVHCNIVVACFFVLVIVLLPWDMKGGAQRVHLFCQYGF
eukprot:14986574-Ditylum_brightwellii.AAC.1